MANGEKPKRFGVIQWGVADETPTAIEADPHAHFLETQAEKTCADIAKRYDNPHKPRVVLDGELGDFAGQCVKRGAEHFDSVKPGWATLCKRNSKIMERMYLPRELHDRRELVTILDAILHIDDNQRIATEAQNRAKMEEDIFDTSPSYFDQRCKDLKIGARVALGILPGNLPPDGSLACLDSLRTRWQMEIEKRVPSLKLV